MGITGCMKFVPVFDELHYQVVGWSVFSSGNGWGNGVHPWVIGLHFWFPPFKCWM